MVRKARRLPAAPDSGPSVCSVALVKLTVSLKDRSHVRSIVALVQNSKRVEHAGLLKIYFQENRDRSLFVVEFVTDCHA